MHKYILVSGVTDPSTGYVDGGRGLGCVGMYILFSKVTHGSNNEVQK